MPGRALEEDLGTRLAVDVRVHALARAVLGVAEGGAGLVGASAAPDFGRVDRQNGFGAANGSRRAIRQRRVADDVERGPSGKDARPSTFKQGRRRRAVDTNLSEFHFSI
jgi:hypothetical protein